MKNLFVFLFLCNFLLLCHAHGGGNYEHSDMLASMKPGDKAALLMVHFGTTHDDTRASPLMPSTPRHKPPSRS